MIDAINWGVLAYVAAVALIFSVDSRGWRTVLIPSLLLMVMCSVFAFGQVTALAGNAVFGKGQAALCK